MACLTRTRGSKLISAALETAPDSRPPADPMAGSSSMVRLSSYCRIEAASANPIRTEVHPAAPRVGVAARAPVSRAASARCDDHPGVGPSWQVPRHIRNPGARSTASHNASGRRASVGTAVRSCFRPKSIEYAVPRRAPRRGKIPLGSPSVQSRSGLLARRPPTVASLDRANDPSIWGDDWRDGMVIGARGRDIPDMSLALRRPPLPGGQDLGHHRRTS